MIHVHRTIIPAPEISKGLRINRPRCNTQDAPAECYTLRETANLIVRNTTHWVKCLACGKQLLSRLPPQDLAGLTPQQLEQVLVVRRSLVARVVTLLAFLLFWAPIAGLVLTAASLAINYRPGGWVKRLTIVAFVLSLLMTVAAVAAMMLDDTHKPRPVRPRAAAGFLVYD